MNRFVILFSLIGTFGLLMSAFTPSTDPQPEREKFLSEKIDSILALMTLEEKVGQMNQYNSTWDLTGPPPKDDYNQGRLEDIRKGRVGSMLNVLTAEATREAQRIAVEESRLGIPLIFGYDVVHGYKTMFPIPLGETASWDLEAVHQSARVAALEASAAGVHWTFAPMVDISRDARWGRVMEGAGEDPFLGAEMAAARVRGFQGDDLAANNTVLACPKHFAAYGLAEAGRDYNTVDISEHTLRNVVLPPFKAAIEAGAMSIMNSFNEIGGIPATGDPFLQREILKGEWGFEGLVVSDWGSIGELVPHGFAADLAHAAELAANAGSDMDMESRAYVSHLVDQVKAGKVKESLIDDAVRRILRIKFLMGLFDDPYKYCDPAREASLLLADEHLDLARDVARKSIVLLKNEGKLLPLPKSGKRIAVIGPLADDKDSPLGSWRAQAVTNSAVSLWEGVQAAVADQGLLSYAQGAPLTTGERAFIRELTFNESDTTGFAEARQVARDADIVVLAIGEDGFQSGEGRSQADIGLAGVQNQLFEAVISANPHTVVVLMSGRPLAIPHIDQQAPAILEAWHLGSMAGHAIADVLFGDYNPSGKLPMTFPRSVGQSPIYYNHKNTGRPSTAPGLVFWSHFTDEPNDPLYPFGYGLSYTTFEYKDLTLSGHHLPLDGQLKVSVILTNTGEYAGRETVQLYLRDKVASVTRPVKELKGFQQVFLQPGESKTVNFSISEADLEFFTAQRKWMAEPGEFDVFVGGNSVDLLSDSFRLIE